MKAIFGAKKVCVSLTAATVSLSVLLTGLAPASAVSLHEAGYSSTSSARALLESSGVDYDAVEGKIEDDLKYFFTEVLAKNGQGEWVVKDFSNPALGSISSHQLQSLLDMLNSSGLQGSVLYRYDDSRSMSAPSAIIKDWTKYAICVVEGATGFKVSPSLLVGVVFLIKEGRWHEAATTLMRGLAENAASGLLDWATKIAMNQLINSVPGAFAARLAVNASLCVMYNQ